ncbi:MAG TPA: hypothetical protein VLK33_13620, partial [Terriglobales bacterium]|nr:hypothetical protein [Terriglobales bacterium]
MRFLKIYFWGLILLFASRPTHASTAAFDLPGPQIEVHVTRDQRVLPISQVPNLQEGDRIWVHPNLSEQQSVHYLLIAAFLRGTTNPPPENWFIKAETWNKRVREEGIVLTVPPGAQQVLLFLAPSTGGDFSTLRSTVIGKPGAFVRAAQDLNQASLDRSRLNVYLELLRKTSSTAPETLHERSILLARSLNIKLDSQCFDRPFEQQVSCLTQNTDQLVLEDGHSQSMVNTLTSGAGSDLIGQITISRAAGGGAYSPYVGAIVDVVRMLDNFHTAGYQYIPALGVPSNDELNLKLNNPPSFRKPKSVLVISLPPIEPAQTPPLRAVNPQETACMQKPDLVLPAEGAPLVFSSELAHQLVLQVKNKSGQIVEIPAKADPERGGFILDAGKTNFALPDGEIQGTLKGYWGFKPFNGPSYKLWNAHTADWSIPVSEKTALIVGRNDVIHLQTKNAACVSDVNFKNQQGKEIDTVWKQSKANELEIQLPLKGEAAGPITLLVKQFGLADQDKVPLQAYSEVGHLEVFRLNAGDSVGTLKGTRLDEVAGLDIKGIHFVPGELSRAGGQDELRLMCQQACTNVFRPGEALSSQVLIKDGRFQELKSFIDSPRPKVALLNKSIESGQGVGVIHLGSEDELPQDGTISFFVKSEVPAMFPRNQKIEVATEDGTLTTMLGVEDGSLILEDAQNVLARFSPLKSFGGSIFGPLRFRPVDADGRKGDWQRLATVVRLPQLTDIHCTNTPESQCTLAGTNLFLIDSIATTADFSDG